MKKLCSVQASMEGFSGQVDVIQWEHGDPFPRLGKSVGVDTETELITDCNLAPKIVVLGVFDPESRTCYIVYWRDVCEFMHELNRRDIEQRYFNLGFDEQVLDNEDPDKTLLQAIDRGKVRDMMVRVTMSDIATIGYKQAALSNLAGCAKHILKFTLDKGDGTEDSARLSFRRYNADGSDYVITEEQARYLPFDCITTWALGEQVDPEPTEVTHTKGLVVLAHISANGFSVDRRVHDALVKDLESYKDEMRRNLVASGYPDPVRKKSGDGNVSILLGVDEKYSALMQAMGREPCGSFTITAEDGSVSLCRNSVRRMLSYLYAVSGAPEDVAELPDCLEGSATSDNKSLRVAEKRTYNEMVEKFSLLAFDEATRPHALAAMASTVLDKYISQFEAGSAKESGFYFDGPIEEASDLIDEHPEWVAPVKTLGAKKYYNQHVVGLLLDNGKIPKADILRIVEDKRAAAEANGQEYTASMELQEIMNHSKLKLETTEKSGEIKLTKQDMWRLSDLGITDKFLEYQTGWNHADKYLSTYMKEEYIKSDGKVHPRFQVLVRTGRTSCTSPNVQNYPSRDKQFALKNMFYAGDGMVLCSTDYSFLESNARLSRGAIRPTKESELLEAC